MLLNAAGLASKTENIPLKNLQETFRNRDFGKKFTLQHPLQLDIQMYTSSISYFSLGKDEERELLSRLHTRYRKSVESIKICKTIVDFRKALGDVLTVFLDYTVQLGYSQRTHAHSPL
jgi:hypothetical protein